MIEDRFSNPVSFTYVNAPGGTVAHGSGMTVRSFTSWTASEAPDPFETEPRLTSATVRLWNAFAPLDPELRRWGLAVGSVRPCQAGDACLGAEEVAVVVSGCLSLDAPGSDLTADLLGPGDVLAAGGPRTASGRWITDGELYCVDMEAWIETVGAEGVAHLLAAVERRRMGLERRILCASTHRATARVADLFLAIHEASPGPAIALSQERLGEMLGLRRTTVNGSCRALEIGGASRTRRGQIRIVDEALLAQAACGCRAVLPPRLADLSASA